MPIFTGAFLAALVVSTGVRWWLARRHMRHICAHRAAVPAEFEGRITLQAHQKAADYTVAKTRLSMVEDGVGALMALAFTLGGGLQALSETWSRVFTPGGLAHGIALLLSAGLIAGAVELPFAAYRTFTIETRFGFNRMTPALFLADLAKKLALTLAIGIPLAACVLWLMARMGGLWWLYVWGVMIAFNVAVVVLYPSVIAPLFNKFSPMQDPQLRGRIEALLARCGFRAQGLFVIDSSRRSTHGNAYFWGFGRAKRIVFFDTLLERLSPAEIEAVLAHELGHFKRHHIWKLIGLQLAFSLGSLALLGWLMNNAWFYTSLGVRSPGTAMALLLFFIALPPFTFLLHPLVSLYSRRQEYEADAYAALQAPAHELVRALVKLYQDNAATLTPDPLHSAFYDSHPPAMLRIARLQGAAA